MVPVPVLTPTPPLVPVVLVPELLVLVPEVLLELVLLGLVGVVLVLVVVVELELLVLELELDVEVLEFVAEVAVLAGRHWLIAAFVTEVANVPRSLRRDELTSWTLPTAAANPWLSAPTASHLPLRRSLESA